MANTIKQIGIKDSAGAGYDNRDIGAEAQNVEVSFNSQGEVIEDITEPGVIIAETKGASEVIKDLQDQIDDKAPVAHTRVIADGDTLGHVKVGNGLEQDIDNRLCVTYGSSAGSSVEGNDPRLEDDRPNPESITFTDNKEIPTTIEYNGSEAKTISYANVGAAPTNHASSSTTYGVASDSNYGHVKIGSGLSVSNGVATVNYGTTAGTAAEGNDSRLSDARMPKSHIAVGTTYGGATNTYYGHAKLSDTYDAAVSGGAATNGVAASQNALYNAYNTLNNNKAAVSHTHTLANITNAGTAASKDVPASGNASSTQVVMGNDTRLSNARPASDVYSWAKASSKPSYTSGEVGAVGKLDASGYWDCDKFGCTSDYRAAIAFMHGTSSVFTTWGINPSSDKNIKKNIKDSQVNAVDLLKNFKAKEFDFIDEKYGKHTDLGYIAQDVEKYIPEMVVKVPKEIGSKESIRQIDYTRVIPYLIEAINEQQQQIEKLKAKLEL